MLLSAAAAGITQRRRHANTQTRRHGDTAACNVESPQPLSDVVYEPDRTCGATSDLSTSKLFASSFPDSEESSPLPKSCEHPPLPVPIPVCKCHP